MSSTTERGPAFSPLLAWAAVVSAALFVGNWWLYAVRDILSPTGLGSLVDFEAYHLAGRAFLMGLNPYADNASVAELARARGWHEGFSSFLYPPTFLPACAALAWVPLDQAKVAWTLGLLCIHAATIACVATSVPEGRRAAFASIATLLTLLSSPFLVHLQRGQVDVLVASLSALALVTYGSWRGWASAFLLALAACIKLTPAFLVVGLVAAHRDVRFVGRFLVAAAALTAVALLTVPWQLFPFYVRDVLPWLSGGDPSFQNQSLVRLVAGGNSAVPRAVSGLGLVGFGLFALSRGWATRSASGSSDLRAWSFFLANVLAMLLFSGISWHMAYVWTIVPVAAVAVLSPGGLPKWQAVLLGLAAVLLHARIEQHIPVFNASNLIGGVIGLAVLCSWLARAAASSAVTHLRQPLP